MPTKKFPASKPRGGVQPKHHARKDKITAMMRRAQILKAAVEGRDLWRVVTGEAAPQEHVMYWADARNQAVRQGNWKLMHFGPNLDEGRFELYDLAGDPYETNDVSKGQQKIAEELKAEISRQMSLDAP